MALQDQIRGMEYPKTDKQSEVSLWMKKIEEGLLLLQGDIQAMESRLNNVLRIENVDLKDDSKKDPELITPLAAVLKEQSRRIEECHSRILSIMDRLEN